ncbi:DNA polymerase III subunit epsilon [Hyphococcus luteus]|uniref:DNA polymerase III subunit epsilon n=1 Tax=Hyphococcus luteus TaxID=2058213 RepID=A0A2S7K6N2_9PROT|nr:DNA polymerase III subunit epsilon [Marinicaulis flavus]PQA88170.1 DNA polymerase III subunit epsilon [Marinicaulis flavus]
MRQIVFDLETTGFKFSEGHRIVEIGGVEMMNGAVTGRNFHTYVNPKRDMPMGAYEVHGLSAEFLSDKPVFTDPLVAEAFLDFVGEAQLVAHNGIGFDLPFLNAELEAAGLRTLPKDNIVDTLHLARRKFPGAPASLDALCSRFGIDTSIRERDGHGALLDSKLLATVYIELTGGLQAGLDFKRDDDAAEAARLNGGRAPARQRPNALPSLVTAEERAAHESFVAELGDEAVWKKVLAG